MSSDLTEEEIKRRAKARVEAERELNESAEERLVRLEAQKLELEDHVALLKEIADTGETVVGQTKANHDLRQQEIDVLKLKLKLEKDIGDETRETIIAKQKALDVERKGYNDAESFAKKFMGITREPTSEFGKFLVDPSARLEGLSSGLGEVVDGMSIMTSTVDKVVESTIALAMEQDQAVVNFRRATGASGEFDDNIRGLERSLFTAGISAAEAGQSVQSLFLNVTDFTEMSEAQQETLGTTVALLNELGVSSETTAKNIQFATKVLGKSTTQAAALQRELFTFAQDLGVSADQMASDFQSMGPMIAALGDNGEEAFRKLQVQAKSTGLALNEILGIVDKFDKFDTAAQSVGKLNALLGGPYLNTLELVAETDPAKRFEILKNNVDAAGLSFDQMDYYQKKALASAMGINEQQLALMMRGRLDLISEPAKSAAEIEALAEQTAQFNTVMQELKQVAMALAVSFGPLISSFKSLLQFLSPVLQLMAHAPGLIWGVAAAYMGLSRAFDFGLEPAITKMSAAEKRSLIIFGIMGGIQLLTYIHEMAGGFWALATAIGIVAAAVWGLVSVERLSIILGAAGLIVAGIKAISHSASVGNSPSLAESFMMVATAIPFMTLAMLGLMPILPALLLLIPPLVWGFTALSEALTAMVNDQFVKNLQLMAIEIGTMVDKINELDPVKAVTFTATAGAAGVAGAALAAVGLTAPSPAPAAAAGGAGGEGPTINVSLNIDGTEFATAVNKVEVSKYSGGEPSDMYNTIVDMIASGITKGA